MQPVSPGRPVRAAIYARMSTDNQNERSPDDQVADCRAFAAEHGWEAPAELVFIDRAISGATAARPAYQRMRAALAAGAFDVLLAFDGSRIARNERDFFELLDDLQAAGARAISVSTRQSLDDLSERFQSVISAYDRQRIAAGTRRGLKARARGARATGGLAYGYTAEPCADGGKRIIVKPAEAAVVRRIFERYAEGQGLKALAHELNAERVPAPTPRGVRAKEGAAPSWAPTSLREMLRNDLYRGRLVYNRSRWVRQRNGKRKRFDRPREEWIVQDVPELRIVSEERMERGTGDDRAPRAGRMGPPRLPARGANRRSAICSRACCAAASAASRSAPPEGAGGSRARAGARAEPATSRCGSSMTTWPARILDALEREAPDARCRGANRREGGGAGRGGAPARRPRAGPRAAHRARSEDPPEDGSFRGRGRRGGGRAHAPRAPGAARRAAALRERVAAAECWHRGSTRPRFARGSQRWRRTCASRGRGRRARPRGDPRADRTRTRAGTSGST